LRFLEGVQGVYGDGVEVRSEKLKVKNQRLLP